LEKCQRQRKLLFASPGSKKLFQRAIIESGAFGLMGEPPLTGTNSAESAGSAFAAAVGCTSAACLRALPTSTILANQEKIFNPFFIGPPPNIDGLVLPSPIENILKSGEFNKVPLINGSNHTEFRSFIPTTPAFGTLDLATANFSDNVAPNNATFSGAVTYTQALADIGVPSIIQSLVEHEYPGGKTDKSANAALAQVPTDEAFACRALLIDGLVSRVGVPVFAYELNDEKAPNNYLGTITTHDGKNFPYGAFHSAELQFLFPVSNLTGVGFNLPKKPLSGPETALSSAMISYWVEFAKTGSPNSSSTSWPNFTPNAQNMLSLVPPSPSVESSFDAAHHCSSFWNSIPTPTRQQMRPMSRFDAPWQPPH
jgi:para-nitrobenzyl esterase